MSKRSQLVTDCRSALDDSCPVDYAFEDADIIEFINRSLKSMYPTMHREVVNDEIRVRYDQNTYDLSTMEPPVKDLVSVHLVTAQDDSFFLRHYTWDDRAKLLIFEEGFYRVIYTSASGASQTGEKFRIAYNSYLAPLKNDNQECELDAPDEELILLKVQELALKKLRHRMLNQRVNLPTETWNELDRIVVGCERDFERMLQRKAMVDVKATPTRRKTMRSRRIRMG